MGIRPLIRPAVFLDRDGVLTRVIVREGRPYAPQSLEELEILPGVRDALARLRGAGFALVVVTNQPDVARGRLSAGTVRAMHRLLQARLPIDDIRVCLHDDADACGCRKPSPGLILAAARDHRLHLAASFMIGDRWRDVDAGRRAGCTTILIDAGYAEPQPAAPDVRVASLPEATDWILASVQRRARWR